jgi:DNA polymerase-3 subunit gamma/tau
VVTALYRRYRPETFAEMIGQSQVTDPLMTALRTNRVNHAYLFSGPRGCGKTTSARILARCLNCAEGPTDTPCGVCPSCVELGRDGPGSLDVVEIDAASHNGVDDARDLRERAVFAPARDRFKIFILDEAHMVTPQGFNALLKIVEEPPEHIKFIFATTEPDKVIGTIRSRTHHYPFRLIPPAQLLEYVQSLCDSEGVDVAPGVLPLVVRAGGGSARDTLSLLDQLIAGSENNHVDYERAVALLGYTHGALLSEAVDALGTHDGAAVFDVVDRVIQTGQDPRRFVEDLLERLRDIIVVEATREHAAAVLRGVPADDLEVMRRQAALFGHAELSRVADIVNTSLSEMTGATSPRLHLELMMARALVPASDDSQRGALARVERLERRIGVDAPDAVGAGAPAAPSAPARGVGGAGSGAGGAAGAGGDRQGGSAPAASAQPASAPVASAQAAPAQPGSAQSADRGASTVSDASATTTPRDGAGSDPSAQRDSSTAPPSGAGAATPPDAAAEAARRGSAEAASQLNTPEVMAVPPSAVPVPAESSASVARAAGEVTLQQLKDAWPEILEVVQKAKMTAWLVVFTAQVRALEGDVLTLAFPSENDVASFKERSAPGQGVSEYLRQAIVDVLGLRVKYIARVDSSLRPQDGAPAAPAPAAQAPAPAPQTQAPAPAPQSPAPAVAPQAPAPHASAPVPPAPAPHAAAPAPRASAPGSAPVAPAVAPTSASTSASAAPAVAPAPDETSGPASGARDQQAIRESPSDASSAPSDDDEDEEFDEDEELDELPPAEDLPPEPKAIVDSSGWTVPGLNENTAAAPADAAPESDSAEVARMRAQLAALKGGAPASPSTTEASPQRGSSASGVQRPPAQGPNSPAPEQRSPAQGADAPVSETRSPSRPPVQRPEQAARQQPSQESRPSGRPQAQATGAAPAQATTSWDVVAIPTSSADEAGDDEGDEPVAVADIIHSAFTAPVATPVAEPRASRDSADRPRAAAAPQGYDDEAPYFDEPMPSDEPDLPADRGDALPGQNRSVPQDRAVPQSAPRQQPGRPAEAPNGGATRQGDPAARPGALRFEASGPETPVAPASAAAPHSAAPHSASPHAAGPGPAAAPSAPTHGGRARYGEAVVREILNASFIEEQPLPGRE